jgi:isopenicillin N synthase-like dioxygenase/predicted N-acetyltransferase YhbS
LQLRSAQPHEYERLGAITVEAYVTLEGHTDDEGYEQQLADVASRATAAATTVLVAVDDGGQLLGGVTYVDGPDSPMAEDVPMNAAGIRMLAVAVEAQRRGVGEALVRACIDRAAASGRDAVVLHTTPWMRAAHRLYERFGFERTPARDWEVTPGLILLAYELDLAPSLPIIDIEPFLRGEDDRAVASAVDRACRDTGFFYVVGHGVDAGLQARLDDLAREFFALPDGEKADIAMSRGGRAWRGWFPVGGELTSGQPDQKEGVYFGLELARDDPRVVAHTPLHGPNLFPERPAGLGATVLEYMAAVTAVGHAVLRAMAVGLGLEADWFARNLTADPLVLFRIFHYPPLGEHRREWSVGEHTDYGLITILRQDDTGGLEVKGPHGWIDAAPVPGAFVVNLGDMLERMTGGRYRSTPHRVRNATDLDRISFPLFLDPGWDVDVRPVPSVATATRVDDGNERWDGANVHEWSGTYGDYVTQKVGRVFPQLRDDVM